MNHVTMPNNKLKVYSEASSFSVAEGGTLFIYRDNSNKVPMWPFAELVAVIAKGEWAKAEVAGATGKWVVEESK